MARSHIAIALGTALIAALIVGQLIASLGFPHVDFWHTRFDQDDGYYDIDQTNLFHGKQSGDAVDDPSSYLIGVGRADITGCV